MLANYLYVGLGGCLGAMARYGISSIVMFQNSTFPIGTLLINFLGSVFISYIAEKSNGLIPYGMSLFLRVGVCGGFTTFSTFSLESVALLDQGKYGISILYILLSVVLCIGGIYAGKIIARYWF